MIGRARYRSVLQGVLRTKAVQPGLTERRLLFFCRTRLRSRNKVIPVSQQRPLTFPGGVSNLGFSWCPASVSLQVRSFALQAAGAECAIATGSSSTPEQVEARRREIRAACDRLAALGQGNCQCPPGLR